MSLPPTSRPTTVAPVTPSMLWTLAGSYLAEITGGVVLRFPRPAHLPEVP
jgi:hypothetical protein